MFTTIEGCFQFAFAYLSSFTIVYIIYYCILRLILIIYLNDSFSEPNGIVAVVFVNRAYIWLLKF